MQIKKKTYILLKTGLVKFESIFEGILLGGLAQILLLLHLSLHVFLGWLQKSTFVDVIVIVVVVFVFVAGIVVILLYEYVEYGFV